jgi:hypothetical protein
MYPPWQDRSREARYSFWMGALWVVGALSLGVFLSWPLAAAATLVVLLSCWGFFHTREGRA